MAVLSVEAGAQGLVCSPREVSAVRSEVGPDVTLITPSAPPGGEDTMGAGWDRRKRRPRGADLLVIDQPPSPVLQYKCRRSGRRRVAAQIGR